MATEIAPEGFEWSNERLMLIFGDEDSGLAGVRHKGAAEGSMNRRSGVRDQLTTAECRPQSALE